MEYWSRIFVPNISAKYFRRNAIKKKGKSGQLSTLAPNLYENVTSLPGASLDLSAGYCTGK